MPVFRVVQHVPRKCDRSLERGSGAPRDHLADGRRLHTPTRSGRTRHAPGVSNKRLANLRRLDPLGVQIKDERVTSDKDRVARSLPPSIRARQGAESLSLPGTQGATHAADAAPEHPWLPHGQPGAPRGAIPPVDLGRTEPHRGLTPPAAPLDDRTHVRLTEACARAVLPITTPESARRDAARGATVQAGDRAHPAIRSETTGARAEPLSGAGRWHSERPTAPLARPLNLGASMFSPPRGCPSLAPALPGAMAPTLRDLARLHQDRGATTGTGNRLPADQRPSSTRPRAEAGPSHCRLLATLAAPGAGVGSLDLSLTSRGGLRLVPLLGTFPGALAHVCPIVRRIAVLRDLTGRAPDLDGNDRAAVSARDAFRSLVTTASVVPATWRAVQAFPGFEVRTGRPKRRPASLAWPLADDAPGESPALATTESAPAARDVDRPRPECSPALLARPLHHTAHHSEKCDSSLERGCSYCASLRQWLGLGKGPLRDRRTA